MNLRHSNFRSFWGCIWECLHMSCHVMLSHVMSCYVISFAASLTNTSWIDWKRRKTLLSCIHMTHVKCCSVCLSNIIQICCRIAVARYLMPSRTGIETSHSAWLAIIRRSISYRMGSSIQPINISPWLLRIVAAGSSPARSISATCQHAVPFLNKSSMFVGGSRTRFFFEAPVGKDSKSPDTLLGQNDTLSLKNSSSTRLLSLRSDMLQMSWPWSLLTLTSHCKITLARCVGLIICQHSEVDSESTVSFEIYDHDSSILQAMKASNNAY